MRILPVLSSDATVTQYECRHKLFRALGHFPLAIEGRNLESGTSEVRFLIIMQEVVP